MSFFSKTLVVFSSLEIKIFYYNQGFKNQDTFLFKFYE